MRHSLKIVKLLRIVIKEKDDINQYWHYPIIIFFCNNISHVTLNYQRSSGKNILINVKNCLYIKWNKSGKMSNI